MFLNYGYKKPYFHSVKFLLSISLIILCAAACKGQDKALLLNNESGKKYQLKPGRKIIFRSADYPVMTKAKVIAISDKKLVVERKKGKREIELDTRQINSIGVITGGTFILGAVRILFYFPFHNLSPAHVQYKRCDLRDEWRLVTCKPDRGGFALIR